MRNNASLFKMCSQALHIPENQPQIQHNEPEIVMNTQKQQNPMISS